MKTWARRLTNEEKTRRLALASNGESRQAQAHALGIDTQSWLRWLERYGVIAKKPTPTKRSPVPASKATNDAVELLRAAMRRADIAEDQIGYVFGYIAAHGKGAK